MDNATKNIFCGVIGLAAGGILLGIILTTDQATRISTAYQSGYQNGRESAFKEVLYEGKVPCKAGERE